MARAAATAAVLVALAGCSGAQEVQRGMQQPGDDQIQETARGLFAAMGVADRMIEYAYDIRRDNPGCAERLGLDADAAYLARRGYAIRAGSPTAAPLVPERLYRAAVAKLVGDGWTVQQYEGPFGGAPAFVATQRDRRVVYYGAQSQFSVAVGPSSTLSPGLSAPTWHEVDEGRFTKPNPPKPPIRTPGAGGATS